MEYSPKVPYQPNYYYFQLPQSSLGQPIIVGAVQNQPTQYNFGNQVDIINQPVYFDQQNFPCARRPKKVSDAEEEEKQISTFVFVLFMVGFVTFFTWVSAFVLSRKSKELLTRFVGNVSLYLFFFTMITAALGLLLFLL
ncbi:hypothetical protein EIN_169570 [Entamoeba invadens IP1]|uniref:Transmembrane protein n=1 Tax=Entamoeba invadens IP1 TaxID=370355 RepID=A0A0A1TVN6_ENTIV|nr:hypothetical protein EIN_169570 [Entamoeba invadens IP1]ELP84512.1 hypothetical protein EIN_169570 [Entamoeba invadens IP1]|eukprot:XP_004183858.1 hypothetical protein EIN_169570 [Entamoeba invadens IP1]